MQIGDLVWARWAEQCMGIVVKIDFEDNIGLTYYRIRWFLDNGEIETVEFEDDLVTVEEKCK
jgi:hypothetical protein